MVKVYQSSYKEVLTCMKHLSTKFGWSIIRSLIDDPKNPGRHLNIFTYVRLLNL